MIKSSSQAVVPGEYLHYKGKRYEVFSIATHSETEEKFVVYRPLYGEAYEKGDRFGDVWVRPLEMFVELVNVNGDLVQRFRLL